MLTAGLTATLANRRRAVVDFGLASTALQRVSPTSAKTTGTMCGDPAAVVVASRATRAAPNLAGASSRRGLTAVDYAPRMPIGLPFGSESTQTRAPGATWRGADC